MKNALTIDLEDWYHPELVRRHVHDFTAQTSESANRILELLDKYNVKATFFVVGEVAEKNPELIRKIREKGHEIGFQGMSHVPLWQMDAEKFDSELKLFSKLISKISGNTEIIGFRAPTYSLDNSTNYALGCLVDNGYKYDSSIFPVKTPLYGLPHAPTRLYKPDPNNLTLENNQTKIIEFPLTVYNFWKLKIPIGGGFYFRVIPYRVLKRLLKKINEKSPFVISIHPWETYHGTPRLPKIGFKAYIITYYGINNCLGKFEKLLGDFEFEPMRQVIGV
jgi:peptidoglycan-N-acetylglucosamine deacetylase